MKGKLFIVPTPIGNLKDITYRAVEVLKQVDLILAEDTRQTKKLLDHYAIDKPMWAHHKFNEHKATESVVGKLKQGAVMALVSDGGTPAISDPGFYLVRACIQQDVQVETLPGATAFVPALVNSGFPSDNFTFLGFPPHKKGRKTLFENIAQEKRTVILYESPHRIVKTLEQIVEYIGAETSLSISRELSKTYEETLRGTALELLKHFKTTQAKGEFVVVVAR